MDFNAGVANLGEIGGSGGRDARPLRKRSARLAMRTEAWGYMTDYIPFDWQDPFRLDDQIAPEEGAIRDLARDYCQAELQPRIRSAFRNEEFDRSDRKSTRLNSSH